MSQQKPSSDDTGEFSLVLGGPLYQLYIRTHSATPTLDLLHRRIVGIAAITWLPLLLLALLGGQAVGNVKVPFLLDIDTQVRFLGSVPLLIAAELIVHQRIRGVVRQFVNREIIVGEDRRRFETIIASTMSLRNSVLIEAFLLVFAFSAGHWLWREHVSLNAGTWYAAKIEGQTQFTPAGYWYAFVSLPIARFIGLRWYFRILLWYRLLWHVSRLPLRLNPLHPDRAGGLGFLAGSVFAFGPMLLAHTVLLAGLIANQIWHEGATLPEFKLEIVGIVAFLMLLVLAPLTFFVFHMARAKRACSREYGIVASRYVNEFHRKWLNTDANQDEPLLGTSDIQSLADLSNSFEVARTMQPVPFHKGTVIQLAILTVLPLVPLTLTMIPLEEMIDRAITVVL